MFKVYLPRLGQTMEEGTIVNWLKGEGEEVNIGDDFYEVETEKTTVIVEATRGGRLLKIVVPEDETVDVGTVLAVAGETDEQPSDEEIDHFVREDNEPAEAAEQEVTSEAPSSTPPSGEGKAGQTKVAAAPRARALAGELGVDLGNVHGTGPDGLVTADDVRRAAGEGAGSGEVSKTDSRIERKEPISSQNRAMMRSVEKGWSVPQFTQQALIDATALVQRKDSMDGFSYMDFFLDAMVSASREVPEVLACVLDGEIGYYSSVDITIATATDRGLLVPVLKGADTMSFEERGPAWRKLVQRANENKLAPDEMAGGMIALSNLGSRGVDSGTALLPEGHSAIVFFGSLEKRPLVTGDGKLEVRPSVYMSVTYDHRIIDGALGSRYTTAMRNLLETP